MDEVLISRCQAGDANAFGLLFEQYKNLVYKTAYLMTGKAADAEDIPREIFLYVLRYRTDVGNGLALAVPVTSEHNEE